MVANITTQDVSQRREDANKKYKEDIQDRNSLQANDI